MKNLFLIISKKFILIFLCVIVCIAAAITIFAVKATSSPKPQYTIVIDAGHGGVDGGAVGRKTGITESEINLTYAKTLKEICENLGMSVVLTRKDMNGLYSPLATNRKRSDMEKRRDIIKNSNADIVISIHMNAFASSSSRGSQVFYGLGNAQGKILAASIQNAFRIEDEFAKALPKEGDFYILNCVSIPGALVEYGFLSNAEDEKLLINEDYRQKMCQATASGILNFLDM